MTLVGHFVSSPREREKTDRRISRGDEREGQGRKESEETEEINQVPCDLQLTMRMLHGKQLTLRPAGPDSTDERRHCLWGLTHEMLIYANIC